MKVRRIILVILLLLVVVPLQVKAQSNYLYDVLKNEAENNGLAREYTGEHHDSFTEEPSKKIYHWYASNTAKGNEVQDKNNVIFADQCWQMLRTTDTGGVKLIYNGIAVDNQCLSDRNSSFRFSDTFSKVITDSYYYADDYIYNKENNSFTIRGNPIQSLVNAESAESLIGKYTCLNSNINESCSTLYYVENYVSRNQLSVFSLSKTNANYDNIGETYLNRGPGFSYMYNETFNKRSYGNKKLTLLSAISYHNKIWVADTYSYNPTTNKYSLIDPYEVSSSTEAEHYVNSAKEKYTFLSNSSSTTGSTLSYITNYSNNYYTYLNLKDGQTLEDVNYSITYGNSFINNGDGTYTIENPKTIKLSLFSSGLPKKIYVCLNTDNNTCEDLLYFGSNSDISAYSLNVKDKYIFANDFTYEDGHYILNNDRETIWNYLEEDGVEVIKNHHYTCWNDTGECDKLYYVFYLHTNKFTENKLYLFEIKNGEKADNYLERFLSGNNVNKYDSLIKFRIDTWYKIFMTDYTKYLEDTIFCNNRSIKSIGGWDPNGGIIKNSLIFNYDKFVCQNITDQFSLVNEKAKLEYPIGLLTFQEVKLLGYAAKSKSDYWTMTPHSMNDDNKGYSVGSSGSTTDTSQNSSNSIRPVISLKENTRYESGTGSKENPYIVDYNDYYSINVEIKNETEDLNIEIEDMSQVTEGEEVKFKLTPIKGYKVTDVKIVDSSENEIEYTTTDNKNYIFTMPRSNVTIKPSYEKVSNSVEVEENSNTKEFKIEVNDATAVIYEDKVVFSIIPEADYEVENIIITDENNNNIEYRKTSNENEYEFIMPDTNVIIKPVYRKKESPKDSIINPNTGRIELLFIIITLLSIIIGTYTLNKKDKRT